MEKKKRTTMILLAGGSGKRMNSHIPKQFLNLGGKPVLCYCLEVIEKSVWIDDCIVVTTGTDMIYMKEKILETYGFSKVRVCCEGGAERYLSVYCGIQALKEYRKEKEILEEDEIVYIQDGARPFLSEKMLQDTYEAASLYGGCVVAVPSKDTIKISDENGFADHTPERKRVWQIQTPQVFQWGMISTAYDLLNARPDAEKMNQTITDDACVVETMLQRKVKLVEGTYSNLKITTPEDLVIAEALISTGKEAHSCARTESRQYLGISI